MIRFASLLVIGLGCALWIPQARAQMQDPSDLVARVGRLEETIRNLTGSVQELQYHNQQLEQQVQSLQAALQSRGGNVGSAARPSYAAPQQPAAQYTPPPPQYSSPQPAATYSPPPPQYSPPPAATESAPEYGHHDAFNPTVDPNAPGAPRPLGSSTNANEPPPVYQGPQAATDSGTAPPQRQAGAPLNLSSALPQTQTQTQTPAPDGAGSNGRLPPPPPIDPSATGAQVAALPPTSSPRDEYDLAYGYVQHKDYTLAAETFRAFMRNYPTDRLAPEAQYYLGEALYQSKNYHDAAEAFLAVSTKYQTNAKAPDALLRLGQSLAALGEKEAACASFGEVLRKYPRASLSVKQGVDREQKRVHC